MEGTAVSGHRGTAGGDRRWIELGVCACVWMLCEAATCCRSSVQVVWWRRMLV